MGRAPFVSCNFFEKRIAAAHIYQAAVHIMIFNKEERTYWIESYKNFPTSNISDAMDNLGLRSGVVLGLHPLDVYQPRTAGFAKTLRQMRRKTAFDGKSLTKQASIIDNQTEYGDLLVIEATGLTDVATGGAMLATRAQMRGVMGELTNGSLRDIDEIADLKFPVYLGGTSPVKSARIMETVDVDVPVFLGGVQICPEDLVLMDRTGVAVVPSAHLKEVLLEAEKIKAKEDRIEANVRGGMSLNEARLQK